MFSIPYNELQISNCYLPIMKNFQILYLVKMAQRPERKDRMVNVEIQGGVLSRVVHIFDELNEQQQSEHENQLSEQPPATSSTSAQYPVSIQLFTIKISFNRL